MTFEDQLNALIFFHLEEHTSARHLIQTLQQDDFALTDPATIYNLVEQGLNRFSVIPPFQLVKSRGRHISIRWMLSLSVVVDFDVVK